MLKLQQPAAPCGADAVKGEARIRVMRSGHVTGTRASPSVRGRGRRPRRPPRDPDRGRVQRRPCRLFAAQRQSRRWPDPGARRGGVRLQAGSVPRPQFNSGATAHDGRPAPRGAMRTRDRSRSRDLGLWWGVGPRRGHTH